MHGKALTKKRGMSAGNFMKAIQSYHLIKPEDLLWRPSNLMKIPNAQRAQRGSARSVMRNLFRYMQA
jgi:hypothetical protein